MSACVWGKDRGTISRFCIEHRLWTDDHQDLCPVGILEAQVAVLEAQVRAVKKANAVTWDPLERPAAWDYYTVWKRLQAAINEALEVGDR